jgi:NADH-quinone oxidoreductase subunit G
VLRVLPLENEEVNEVWISDRDRFSYPGLYAPDRLARPMIKQGGAWSEVDWQVALDHVAHALQRVKAEHGAQAIGALAAPLSTLEELYLLGKLVRALGSDNVDFRLRQSDFSGDSGREGAPWLGMKIADLSQLEGVLLIGSFLRKDQPLLSARLRHAAKHGCQVSVLHAADDDLLMPIAAKAIVRPSRWVQTLAEIADALDVQPGDDQSSMSAQIAATLTSGQRKAILLGNAALQHPQAEQLLAWARRIADKCGATVGVLSEAANSVGGYLVGALPQQEGLNAAAMLREPRKATLLWNVEPDLDTADPSATAAALRAADTVIAFSPYRNGAFDYADVILPITPFTETAGTFVNCEGRVQSFNGSVRPVGDARPGWKVLRVLGNLLELPGFDYDTPEQVRSAALPADVGSLLSNRVAIAPKDAVDTSSGIERLADVPIYFADAIVRRSPPLQATRDARPPKARANAHTIAGAGLTAGDKVRVRQGDASALLELEADETLADGVVRVSAAHESTSTLGPMFGPVTLERA